MASKLSVHLMAEHMDFEGIAEVLPRSVKIVNPDYERCRRAYTAAPGALFVLRDHPLSEQHDFMLADPERAGREHAQSCARNVALWEQAIPRSQIVVTGINEPLVWTPGGPAVAARYSVAFLDRCTELGLRAGALNLSVGWPADHGVRDSPPNWAPYEPVREAIVRGGHYLVLHEYWDPLSGPADMWRWWAGRYTQCPWDVPIIIGECGADRYVRDGGTGFESRGWAGNISPEEYMRQLAWYDAQLQADPRIHSAQVFTWDFAPPWGGFDVRPLRGPWARYAQEAQDQGGEVIATPLPKTVSDAIRTAAWAKLGVPLNQGAAFYHAAAAHNLGRPVTAEFELEVAGRPLRAQAYDGGIVYAVVGDWENVLTVAWTG